MKKQGRNEPCACGSGKKYKKCCGHHDNIAPFEPAKVNQELAEIQQELDKFLGEEQVEPLAYAMDNLLVKADDVLNEEEIKLYTETMLPWVAMYYKIEGKDTLFKAFYEEKIEKISNITTKRMFSQWQNPVFSVFEIMGIDATNKSITLNDILTNKTYDLGFDEAGNERVGDLLAGALVPYYATYQFVFGALTMPKDVKQYIMNVLEEDFDSKTDQFINGYPDFLLELFHPNPNRSIETGNTDDLEWPTPADEEVANIMTEHMLARGVDQAVVYTAIIFWNNYTKEVAPVITKPAAYAAAVDYYLLKELDVAQQETQSKLAKIYGTTSGTISNHNRKFIEYAAAYATEEAEDPVLAELFEEEELYTQVMEELEKEAFESEKARVEEAYRQVEAIMNQRSGKKSVNTLLKEAAQTTGEERQKRIELVLEKDPTNLDAFILLAQDAESLEEAKKILEKALELGRQELGEKAFKEADGNLWMNEKARPYMVTKVQLALVNRAMNNLDEAIKHAEEMLELNTNDNQGIRDLIIPLYIETKNYDKAQELIDKYDEETAHMAFSKALLYYKQTEDKTGTLKRLTEAMDINPYVVPYISGEKAIPSANQQIMEPGEESEAIVYALNNIHLWQEIAHIFP